MKVRIIKINKIYAGGKKKVLYRVQGKGDWFWIWYNLSPSTDSYDKALGYLNEICLQEEIKVVYRADTPKGNK